MEFNFNHLNEEQQIAVTDDSEVCVVNASVGSGKTTVLISKILYLHYEKAIPFKKMFVLTFTNKAANEIKERLIALDPKVSKEDLVGFGTFHSVALNLLKQGLADKGLGYRKDFLVIEPEEELDIALQTIHEKNLKIKYLNRLKNRLEKVVELGDNDRAKNKYQDQILELIPLLKEEKIKQNKMSFNDLLSYGTDFLRENRVGIDYIIIDEIQDSDSIQFEFIKALKQEKAKIFAVGDRNQVIYNWRGTRVNIFEKLVEVFGAKELSLPLNYRSSKSILEVAKCFLEDKNELTGVRELGKPITIVNHYNPFNEALYLVERISKMVTEGVNYNDIAIFYRLQYQAEVICDVFSKNNIPFEISLKKTFSDYPVLNWIIKVLRYSINSKDLSAGIAALTNSNYGKKILPKKAKTLVVDKKLEEAKLLDKMLLFKECCTNFKVASDYYDYFELDDCIKPTSATYLRDKELLITFFNSLTQFISESSFQIIQGIGEFVSLSTLNAIDILQNEVSLENEKVQLMTLHSSKGLEFKNVFIIGVNYGLIPLRTTTIEENEEEKRLFFVGVTRAKDNLELSYYTEPNNTRVSSVPSVYINQIPKNLVLREEGEVFQGTLQDLRKQVSFDILDTLTFEKEEKRVKHIKYGVGVVVKEVEDIVCVSFEGYGEKEFFKAFGELEYL